MNETRRHITGRRIAIVWSYDRNWFDEFEDNKWELYLEFIVKGFK